MVRLVTIYRHLPIPSHRFSLATSAMALDLFALDDLFRSEFQSYFYRVFMNSLTLIGLKPRVQGLLGGVTRPLVPLAGNPAPSVSREAVNFFGFLKRFAVSRREKIKQVPAEWITGPFRRGVLRPGCGAFLPF